MQRPFSSQLSGLPRWVVMASSLMSASFGGACGPSSPPVPPPRAAVVAQRPSGASQSLTGEVLGVDRTPVEEQNNLTLRLRLTPGDSRTVAVDLGPGWSFDEQGLHFEMNEHLVVYGQQRVEDGQTIVVAHELEKSGTTFRRDPETGRWEVVDAPPADAADGADQAPSSPTAP